MDVIVPGAAALWVSARFRSVSKCFSLRVAQAPGMHPTPPLAKSGLASRGDAPRLSPAPTLYLGFMRRCRLLPLDWPDAEILLSTR